MFFNGFILNLIVTPGGIESLGGSSASDIGFALITLAFFTLQAAILWLCYRFYVSSSNFKLSLKFVPVTVIMATIIVHMWFAVDHQTKNQLIIASESIPLYQTVSARRFLKVLGIDNKEAANIRVKGKLNYPLAPIQVEAPAKPYNIIWLTSESWRADTLNEKVMPNSWEFAKNAARFTKNYSGGNGTRMGVFSMFTGLPGSYWFPFLAERRGAYLIDLLKNQNYQMRLFTSARFTYPEFNQTIFSQVPKEQLQETRVPKSGWENDRDNVSDLLSFIDKRDPNKPFFTFMFFESPHARYYFPTNSVIAKPYRDDLNYATLSKEALAKDIGLIRNRYINSVHHLDMQYGRIFEYMKKNQLLDNTIVILIGDHGEEFMENGYWGHNSTFADPQVRTPLVIYKPGMKPFIEDQMTSHMDVIPTVMPLLGVKNPSSDYAIGYNLLAGEKRTHTYIADWNKVAYVDREVKITQPFNSLSVAFSKATAGDDRKLSKTERESLLGKKTNEIVQLAVDLRKFFKKSEAPTKSVSTTKPI
jgi:membrane-anchored protein YejM (alkaline phosphatase superfamily)